jgi:hypothetical protein
MKAPQSRAAQALLVNARQRQDVGTFDNAISYW